MHGFLLANYTSSKSKKHLPAADCPPRAGASARSWYGTSVNSSFECAVEVADK